MNRFFTFGLMSLLILVFALGSVGCEQEGSAEKAGQSIDRMAEKAGDTMEEAKEAAAAKAEEAGAYIDDAAITAKIKADVLADPMLKVFQISVTTTNGVVTLSGEVDSQASIDRSQAIASGVENVESVRNELVVKAAE
ncbi:hyperosmotically inducible protein [Thiocapsa rosea]|uniref:Hyperosmotically inducible protein n=2 Tax=Thiocapsa rosea TaxID=69360 RepID=A0A495V7G4_9GAMM|nr:hyperosmotically inducible protein [Thiocapsa rosea]